MNTAMNPSSGRYATQMLAGLLVIVGIAAAVLMTSSRGMNARLADDRRQPGYKTREPLDTGGFFNVLSHLPPWKPDASLAEISALSRGLGYRNIEEVDRSLSDPKNTDVQRLTLLVSKAILFNYEGEPDRAYEVLTQARSWVATKE